MSEDQAGGFWIGGAGALHSAKIRLIAGNPRVTRITDLQRRIEQRYPALPEMNIGSDSRVARDSVGQIVGYESGQLLCYNGKHWRDLTPLLNGSEVWNLQTDKQGRVWVCTGGAGLIGIQGKTIQRYNDDPDHAKSCIYRIAEASNGDLYVGTQYGLWRLKGQMWEDLSGPQNQIMQAIQMVVDGQDRVWVVDPNFGIFVYCRNAFTQLSRTAQLKGKDVCALRLTSQGNVEADTIDHSQNPAVSATYRWLPHTALLMPELVKK